MWDLVSLPFWIKEKCSLAIIPKHIVEDTVAWPMKKNSPYRKMFNYYLSKLHESGHLSRMWALWEADQPEDCFAVGVSGLGISNVLTAFLALGGALFLSLSILCCERLHRMRTRK